MSDREVEREETKQAAPPQVRVSYDPPRPQVLGSPLTDLRMHNDTRAVRRTGRPVVARDFIDDIKDWWSGEEPAARVEKPETPVTKQDFDQVISLVSVPLANAEMMLAGDADVAKAKLAMGKLVPAANAMMVIANTKKEPQNRDKLYAPIDDITAAITTLQVMSEPDKAAEIWKDHFTEGMKRVDEVLALPIRDESQDGQGQAAAPSDDTLTQRDHDLIQASLKPQLQTLITTTSGVPYEEWDPKAVAADTAVVSAASAFSNRKLLTVKARVQAGMQAIKAFTMSLNDQQAEALAQVESAHSKLAQAMQSYVESAAPPPEGDQP